MNYSNNGNRFQSQNCFTFTLKTSSVKSTLSNRFHLVVAISHLRHLQNGSTRKQIFKSGNYQEVKIISVWVALDTKVKKSINRRQLDPNYLLCVKNKINM